MAKKYEMTKEHFEALEQERKEITLVKQPKNVQAIKEAKAQGDLSENAEYSAALEEKEHLQDRLEEIEMMLNNAVILEVDTSDTSKVSFGFYVKIQDMDDPDEEPEEYRIVGSTEAKVLEGKISNESPLGKALMNQQVGAVVEVEAPGGTIKYQILGIRNA